jgi:SAM-dependent methyltransferase
MKVLPEPSFRPHPVAWTPGKIARFWDARASSTVGSESYFSWQVGDSLINLVQGLVPLRQARVLDYGSGPGFLVEKLVRRGISTAGLDSSPASVAALQARLGGQPAFLGALLTTGIPNPVPGNSYDIVFFLETLEHLLLNEITPTLAEIRRITRPGGYLIVTTPNEENLDLYQQLCPDCGARFHYMQHLTSWNQTRLGNLMLAHGFSPTLIRALTLSPNTPLAPARALLALVLRSRPLNLVGISVRQ